MTNKDNPLSISKLVNLIKTAVDEKFKNHSYWVVSEISSLKLSNGHYHFDCVEKNKDNADIVAKISCKLWKSNAQLVKSFESCTGQSFTSNINVLLCVSINFHSVRGLSLIVNDIDTNYTIGQLAKEREKTLQKLCVENPDKIQLIDGVYKTYNKSLSIPLVLKKIAVLSSSNSDGYNDFCKTLQNNNYNYKFNHTLYNVPVQNISNSKLFTDQVISIFNSKIAYDIVVIIRGGGSQSDFLLFDNYDICRAIARFPIPIITGIGHESNSSIADLMAHNSLYTPTKVAEHIISHNKSFEDRINTIQNNIVQNVQKAISTNNSNLIFLNKSIIHGFKTLLSKRSSSLTQIESLLISNSKNLIKNQSIILKNQSDNFSKSVANFIKNINTKIDTCNSLINQMSPVNILKKGYAIVKHNNSIICNPDELSINSDIEIILKDKSIKSTVKSISNNNGTEY